MLRWGLDWMIKVMFQLLNLTHDIHTEYRHIPPMTRCTFSSQTVGYYLSSLLKVFSNVAVNFSRQ